MNLTELTTKELQLLYQDVTAEVLRREKLAKLPEQASGIVEEYVGIGGDRAEIVAVVSEERTARTNQNKVV